MKTALIRWATNAAKNIKIIWLHCPQCEAPYEHDHHTYSIHPLEWPSIPATMTCRNCGEMFAKPQGDPYASA